MWVGWLVGFSSLFLLLLRDESHCQFYEMTANNQKAKSQRGCCVPGALAQVDTVGSATQDVSTSSPQRIRVLWAWAPAEEIRRSNLWTLNVIPPHIHIWKKYWRFYCAVTFWWKSTTDFFCDWASLNPYFRSVLLCCLPGCKPTFLWDEYHSDTWSTYFQFPHVPKAGSCPTGLCYFWFWG